MKNKTQSVQLVC